MLGAIRQKIILARFSTFFAMLYRAGISVLDCIQICEKIVGNRVMEEGLQRVGRSISEGQGISQAFTATKLFPPLVLRMLRVGESTGALDTALLNVSYFYNREVRDGSRACSSCSGPLTTVVLGVLIVGDPLRHLPADLRRDRQDQVLAAMARHFLYLTNTRLVSLIARRQAHRRAARVRGRRARARRTSSATSRRSRHAHAPLHRPGRGGFPPRHDPHVGAGDRDAIVGRKLTQIFRNTPYRHAMLQGREPEGRRDDRVLYTAITNPEVLRPWLEMIERLQRAAGGHPLGGDLQRQAARGARPRVPAHAARHLHARRGRAPDVLPRPRIKFSRLTPIDLEEGQTLGAMLAEETTRTWQYLDSLRNFAADDQLEVCVLVHPATAPRSSRAARLRADPVPPARHRAGRDQARPQAPAARLHAPRR